MRFRSGLNISFNKRRFIHSTNIYSALSISQELFKAKKIYQWKKNTHAKLLRWEGIWHASETKRKPLKMNHTEQRGVWHKMRLQGWQGQYYVGT